MPAPGRAALGAPALPIVPGVQIGSLVRPRVQIVMHRDCRSGHQPCAKLAPMKKQPAQHRLTPSVTNPSTITAPRHGGIGGRRELTYFWSRHGHVDHTTCDIAREREEPLARRSRTI